MTRASIIQTSFTTGEISPRLRARVDLQQYNSGCEILENFMIMPHGGVIKRPGCRFIHEAKTVDKTILVPFRFSTIQAYIIEVGVGYFRFYKDGGIILDPQTDQIYELANNYTADQLLELKWIQSADILFLFHKDVAPQQLMRHDHADWTLEPYEFKDGPYLDINSEENNKLALSAIAVGSVTVTASGTGFEPFVSTDVGRHLRISTKDNNWAWGVITAVTDSTHATLDLKTKADATTATQNWRLGAWGTAIGWPSVATFFEQRLWLGNNGNQPQTVWASRTADYNNFSPTDPTGEVLDDSGLNYTLGTEDVNSIEWLVGANALHILTNSAEFSATSSSFGGAITPTDIRIIRQSAIGCADVQPTMVGKDVLFFQRARRKLEDYFYDYQVDGYRAEDATILSEHITLGGVTSQAYQREPYSIIWITRTDGQLLGFTFSKAQGVQGWHRHLLGGVDAKALCVAVIPATDHDEVWLLTERTINGGKKQYIERLDPEFYPSSPEDKDGAFFVDCGLSYSGPPVSHISGLEHLAGETVQVFADGSVRPDATVDQTGAVDLPNPGSVIHVGLGYRARLKTVQYDAGGNEGTAQTKTGRIQRVGIRLLNTIGLEFGTDDNLEELEFRLGSSPMDESPALFTGDKLVEFPGDYDLDRQVTLVSDQPYPCIILGVVPWMVVYN